MPIPSSARCRCRRWTPALCSRCWNRSGRRSPRRQAACAGASKAFWTSPRCAAIATAKTRRAGAAISTSCCRRVPRCAQVEHHAALPYAELPAFLVELARARGHRRPRAGIFDPDGRAHRRSDRRALERDRLARQDLDGAGRAHEGAPRTPRSAVARGRSPSSTKCKPLAHGDDGDAFVFPGGKPGTPLSNMAFLMLLRRMGRGDLTAHGFRATFKTGRASARHFKTKLSRRRLAHVDRRQGRASLSARRPVREAAPAHAAMGDVLHRRSDSGATRQGHGFARTSVAKDADLNQQIDYSPDTHQERRTANTTNLTSRFRTGAQRSSVARSTATCHSAPEHDAP